MSKATALMKARISRRCFEKRRLSDGRKEEVLEAVENLNSFSGLHLKAVFDDDTPFRHVLARGMFSGVHNYIICAGDRKDEHFFERVGYYGENLVLSFQEMQLGSCWVSGTYDKEAVKERLEEGEKLACIIAFGIVKPKESLREKAIAKTVKRNRKEVREMIDSPDQPENWVINGVRAATLAPSSGNRQPVMFHCHHGILRADVKKETDDTLIDLGIAKLHFELGAERGTWNLGNGAEYSIREYDE